MISIFKRKPKEETVSKPAEYETLAHHNWLITKLREDKDGLREVISTHEQSIRGLDALAAKYKQERDVARAQAAANAADAAKYREKCRRDREYHANRRQAREKQAAE